VLQLDLHAMALQARFIAKKKLNRYKSPRAMLSGFDQWVTSAKRVPHKSLCYRCTISKPTWQQSNKPSIALVWTEHTNIHTNTNRQPDREAVSYRGLFTAGWFGVREKHCSWLEIYDRKRIGWGSNLHWLHPAPPLPQPMDASDGKRQCSNADPITQPHP